MAKEKKPKGDKKNRNTANRLSRADKLSKRLKNISAKTGFKVKSALFTFTVYARQVVEIGGFLIQDSGDTVVLRHKRSSAAQRMVVSRFHRSEVVEVFGAVGEVSSVSVIREVPIREIKEAKLIEDSKGVMTIQTAGGETVKLYQHEGVRITAVADDDSAAEGGGKKSKKDKKDKKADKAEKSSKKSGKKKPKDEDEDDDLDD